jgi:hypothetical protein
LQHQVISVFVEIYNFVIYLIFVKGAVSKCLPAGVSCALSCHSSGHWLVTKEAHIHFHGSLVYVLDCVALVQDFVLSLWVFPAVVTPPFIHTLLQPLRGAVGQTSQY